MASMQDMILGEACWEDAADDPLEGDGFADYANGDGWVRSKDPMSVLIRTIEGEIIPRLVLLHRSETEAAPRPDAGAARQPTPQDIDRFTKLVLADDAGAARDHANEFLSRGLALEGLFMELFAPTARRLGELWVADLCDFTEVTIGVGRLQQFLREFARAFDTEHTACQPGRRALLSPSPGEQHSFGLLIVGEFLRRAGWDVAGELSASREQLCSLVRNEWFAVVGLSLSSDSKVESLRLDITAIRRASRNGDLGVMVGGRVFDSDPELVARIGADGTAEDGPQAVLRAESLLSRIEPSR